MQAETDSKSTAPQGQTAAVFFRFPERPGPAPAAGRLAPKAALYLAALAVECLLTGELHPSSFDQADLEQAAVLLRQMAETIKPVPSCVEGTVKPTGEGEP